MTQFINTQRGSKGEKGDPGKSGASLKSVAFVGNDMVFTDTDDKSVVLANAKIDLKGDTGPKGDTGEKGDAATVNVGTTTTGEPGTQASVTNSGTSSAAVFNFTIPRGSEVSVGSTTTGSPGTSASVTNSGTGGDVVLDFTIPEGKQGVIGPTGNGIDSVTSSKIGKITTVTMDFTDPNMSDFSFTVSDGQDGEGSGDVLGPNSATDGHLAVFDGATGKLIKDGGAVPVVPTIVDALNSQSATSTLSANQGYVLKGYVDTINGKISSDASSSNKLVDKNYVDNSINSVTAYYITKNAQGDQFATYAELSAATTFYSGGVARIPTRNDYCIVLADENHDDATTRYIYQGSQWEYQYTVNETALTQAQMDALDSGITAAKVSAYDGYASTISGKQDALTIQTAYTSKGTSTKVATITTNTLGQVTSVSETNIAFPVTSVNGQTGDVTGLQSALSTQTAYSNKGTSTKVPTITTNSLGQVTAITETNIAFPVTSVNNKTGVVTVQETLVSGTNIKTINGNDILGTGNLSLYSSISITLAAADWSSNEQTVTATGVTTSNSVIVSPAPDNMKDYADALIYCSAQANNSLTFTCTTTPESDIVVNVLILN